MRHSFNAVSFIMLKDRKPISEHNLSTDLSCEDEEDGKSYNEKDSFKVYSRVQKMTKCFIISTRRNYRR